MLHIAVVCRTRIFSTINTLSVRFPTTTHVPKCYENDSSDNTTWQWRAYSETLIMQADGSVVVLKLAVVALELARSLT